MPDDFAEARCKGTGIWLSWTSSSLWLVAETFPDGSTGGNIKVGGITSPGSIVGGARFFRSKVSDLFAPGADLGGGSSAGLSGIAEFDGLAGALNAGGVVESSEGAGLGVFGVVAEGPVDVEPFVEGMSEGVLVLGVGTALLSEPEPLLLELFVLGNG